jgi:hypothetical protein
VNPKAVVTSLPNKVTAPVLVLKLVTRLLVLRPKVTSPVPESTPVLLIVKGLLTNTLVISASPEIVVFISLLSTEEFSIREPVICVLAIMV